MPQSERDVVSAWNTLSKSANDRLSEISVLSKEKKKKMLALSQLTDEERKTSPLWLSMSKSEQKDIEPWCKLPIEDRDVLKKWATVSIEERAKLTKKTKILNKTIKLGLDLRGGMHLVLEVETPKLTEKDKENKEKNKKNVVDQALEVIRNRVDKFGVSEPVIQRQGENRIVVELPGLKDPQRAFELIGKTALLEFRLVDDARLEAAKDGDIPDGYEILYDDENNQFLVKKEPEVTGEYLTDAYVDSSQGESGMTRRMVVAIQFDKIGARKFARATGGHVGEKLAIVLDGRVRSAPVIRTKIDGGNAIVEGNFSLQEAKDLAIVLRAGALPAPIKIIENRMVGPSLGRDSIDKGLIASILGLILVILFMAVYYKLSGVIADVGLMGNILMMMGAMVAVSGTLTIPGIAGIILTIGMSVDSNVLIFERIREELRTGKTIKAAIDAGYKKAFWTVFDSHVTTLIVALILFSFGTGPIKGFAVTLSIGIIISLFTALVITRVIFDLRKEYATLSI
ncbi:protein translocase subunit SecD [bacterium]|nr:protein translocase subunit SecD [bacterium]MBU1754458.1 protein translocase subunit SecD [bacterium]